MTKQRYWNRFTSFYVVCGRKVGLLPKLAATFIAHGIRSDELADLFMIAFSSEL